MDNKERLDWFDVLAESEQLHRSEHGPKNLPEYEKDRDLAVFELRRLIESGGEVEAEDEEREKLIHHLRSEGFYRLSVCPQCDRIITLLRQRRTVSRERVEAWVDKLLVWCMPATRIRAVVYEILAEFGIEVEKS